MPLIAQFVPTYTRHDAISNHVTQLHHALLAAGYRSEIYSEFLDPRMADLGRSYHECDREPDPGRVILYHASTDSAMAGWLIEAAAAGQKVVIDYHNITPSEYFSRWEPMAARSMDRGREELAALLPHTVLALADSGYNEAEMKALGHPRTAVCPLLVDLSEYHGEPDGETVADLTGRGGPLWLFVGRVAPNKCQHDVIAAFAAYRRLYAPAARLALVGGVTSGRYQKSLEDMVDELELGSSVEFVGSAPFAQLLAYFRAADAFVCLSEHEGFCVPVLEAMELGVPVFAFAAAALTETVADAGVLLQSKDPLAVAAAVDAVASHPERRQSLISAGRERAAGFSLSVTSARFVEALSGVLPPPSRSADQDSTAR